MRWRREMEGIFGREIQVGDSIKVDEGLEGKVLKYLFTDSGGRCFMLDCGQLRFLGTTIIGLLHRPYPPGKTEYDMLEAVDAAIWAYWLGLVKPNEGRRAIVRALKAWELGRPQE
jgi:hypothetical protein